MRWSDVRRADVPVERRCAQRWGDLDGVGARRVCGECAEPVTNLSLLSEAEAREALSRGAQCVAYRNRPDGTIVFAGSLRKTRPGLAVVGAAVLAAACSEPASEPPEKPALAEVKPDWDGWAQAEQRRACEPLLGEERRAAYRAEILAEDNSEHRMSCDIFRQLLALGYYHGVRPDCLEE